MASDDSILNVRCWNPTIIQMIKGELVVLLLGFFYVLQKHAFLSLSLCLTTAVPLFTDQSKKKKHVTFVY